MLNTKNTMATAKQNIIDERTRIAELEAQLAAMRAEKEQLSKEANDARAIYKDATGKLIVPGKMKIVANHPVEGKKTVTFEIGKDAPPTIWMRRYFTEWYKDIEVPTPIFVRLAQGKALKPEEVGEGGNALVDENLKANDRFNSGLAKMMGNVLSLQAKQKSSILFKVLSVK